MRQLLAILLSLSLISILLFPSCRREPAYSPRLLEAEAVMASAPDSALTILTSIDTALLTSPADRALHTLLLTQARYKADIEVTAPAPIRRAADYFRTHGYDNSRLMNANYLLGHILASTNHPSQAITSLLEAEQIAISTQDWFYLGLIDRNISAVYNNVYNYDMAHKYSLEAVEAFRKSGNEEYWNYERCNLALCLYNLGRMSEGKHMLDSVINVAAASKDSVTILEALHGICIIKIGQQDWEGALIDYNRILLRDSSYIDTADWQRMVLAYQYLGMTAKADSILKTLESCHSKILVSLHSVYAAKGEYETAYKLLLKQHHYLDTLLYEFSRQEVSKASSAFTAMELEKSDIRTQQMKLTLISSIIGAFAIIGALVGYFLHRRKRLNHKLTSLMRDHKLLTLELNNVNKRNDLTSMLYRTMFKKRFSIIDSFFGEYYQAPSHKRSQQLAKKIEKTMLGIQSDKQFTDEIINEIDQYHDNLILNFRKHCPDYLSDHEYSLLAFLCAGLSNQAISIILSIDISVLYVRKSRLKSKISKSDYPRASEIMDMIS